MPPIRILPADVAGKIAAGEVVERPASVVKELIENAIDAGATRVDVEVEDGGRARISVADDGVGISSGDLGMLFTQHSTSKLARVEDLAAVRTLGFRGEALYSMGAVAEVAVVSRPRGSAEGAALRCRGGRLEAVRPEAAPEGTRVEVRRLFYNVPARRKFLRSGPVEFDHVRDTVLRFAFGHPRLGLRFVRDGQVEFALPPDETLQTRLASAMEKGGDPWIPFRIETNLGNLEGSLGPPSAARTTTRGLYLFVNGRFVRDRILFRAVAEGYREFLVSGRHAAAVVSLRVPPESIDVNVHPAKAEIRFARPGPIFDWIAASVRETLSHSLRAPGLGPSRTDGNGIRAPQGSVVEQSLSRFFGAEAPPEPALPDLISGRRVFQLHRKYLIEEVADGIQIIDQHALHERVMLEELKRSYGSADLPRQRLLVQPSLEVTDEEASCLEEYRRVLESAGFGFETFGPRAVRIVAVPALLSRDRPETLLRDFLDLLSEGSGRRIGTDEILERLACRSAVRFGDSLPDGQIEALLQRREILDNPHVCAHGRPVAIRLTLDELERFFKRR